MAARTRKKETGSTKTASAGDEAGHGSDNLGLIVGQNMKRLRLRRNLSLEGLAKLSGVSRAMLGQVELGRSVPTINVVWKISRAFEVPFSTLITAHDTARVKVLRAKDSKVLTSSTGAFSSRALFPFEGERRTEFYELRLKPQGIEDADPHAAGTMENLAVVRGSIEIEVAGEVQRLGAGDAIVFQADVPHAYRNPGRQEAVAYLVMTYAEASV